MGLHVTSCSCTEMLISGQDPSGSMAGLTPGQQRAYRQPGDMVPGTTTVGAAQHEEAYDQLLLASQQVDHNTTSSSDHDHSNQPSSSELYNQDGENKTAGSKQQPLNKPSLVGLSTDHPIGIQ